MILIILRRPRRPMPKRYKCPPCIAHEATVRRYLADSAGTRADIRRRIAAGRS
jgi:hypothetical protein